MPAARPRPRLFGAMALLVAGACRGDALNTEPLAPDPVANLGTQTTALSAGTTVAEYMVVVANTVLDGESTRSFVIRGDGAASPSLLPAGVEEIAAGRAALPLAPAPAPSLDRAFESRLRDRERAQLAARIPGARAWHAARRAAADEGRLGPSRRSGQSIPAAAKVGDILRVNVQPDSACSAPTYRGARVVAIGERSIVLADTLNPRNGFTDADYRRVAARFDTLVYPLDSAAFGAPTDIDGNGRVALVFTRSVNEQTPRDAPAYVAGFTFSRDLFPVAGSSRTDACPGSNEGELFYLLAPDPSGSINGNPRTAAFVDSTITAVIAHEFQHLINAGRRLYVNEARGFEDKWLDEGLSHIAEELLFYRESGLAPRANLDATALRASTRTLAAYNRAMGGNQVRYRQFLQRASRSSPVARDDELWTRGASWSLLRYLADRSDAGDAEAIRRLANSRSAGVANAVGVFGGSFATQVRDWNVSLAVDDLATGAAAFQQASWNWRSIYANIGGGAGYPLTVQPMTTGIAYSGSVLSGGAAYFRILVPANAAASVSLVEQAGAAPTLSLVTVRTR